jgi:hypothetical protein
MDVGTSCASPTKGLPISVVGLFVECRVGPVQGSSATAECWLSQWAVPAGHRVVGLEGSFRPPSSRPTLARSSCREEVQAGALQDPKFRWLDLVRGRAAPLFARRRLTKTFGGARGTPPHSP